VPPAPLRASAGWDGRYHGLDAGEAYGRLGAETGLGEQPRVFRLGAPAARSGFVTPGPNRSGTLLRAGAGWLPVLGVP
jgi:hypothetical protein